MDTGFNLAFDLAINQSIDLWVLVVVERSKEDKIGFSEDNVVVDFFDAFDSLEIGDDGFGFGEGVLGLEGGEDVF